MKIFFDTNIVLDLILEREGADAARIILSNSTKDTFARAYCSALTIADTAYVIRRFPTEEVKHLIGNIMRKFDILPMGDMQLLDATKGTSPDFEDSIQIACAEHGGCDVILTHNTVHFRDYTEIPVLTPEEFISHCER